MSLADAHRWNARYVQEKHNWQNRSTKQLLLDHEALLPSSGRVLDAASGVGICGKYLAKKGFSVFSLDISIEGLKLAQQSYQEEGLEFMGVVMDLSIASLPEDFFDVILNFCFLERETFDSYRKAIKPGGLIYFETFVNDRADLSYSKHYLEPGELLEAFSEFKLIYYDEIIKKKIKGLSERKVARLVARKRSSSGVSR